MALFELVFPRSRAQRAKGIPVPTKDGQRTVVFTPGHTDPPAPEAAQEPEESNEQE